MVSDCQICGNSSNNRIHRAREMMLGLRDKFDYLECGKCGTIQIIDAPDLNRYYPPNYYSFSAANNFPKSRRHIFEARSAVKYVVNRRNLIGKFFFHKCPWLANFFPVSLTYPNLNLSFEMKILDYGCGRGSLLQRLNFFGFRNLTGADIFVESDIFYPNGVRIFKRELNEFAETFDLIMLHHVFEHLPNPREILREIFRLLKPRGYAIIRLPVIAFAWRHYGVDWVQLDAPRHLFLYTAETFSRLAEEAGFAVENVIYDSEAFQFLGSELYKKDIPLSDKTAFDGDINKSIFTAEQLAEWNQRSAELNRKKDGDQACFYLLKP
ncbi:MAG: class I SAM-dependent methyltransferase [Pyrinomonadaceae bacterium]